MFSGIVETTGEIVSVTRTRKGKRLGIRSRAAWKTLRKGQSVAVNGVCLSAVKIRGKAVEFDVIPETLRKTNLGTLSEGDRVNLERPLVYGRRVDGHFVLGHVEGTARVAGFNKRGKETALVLKLPSGLSRWVIAKGSVALDGVSLTVGMIRGNRLTVYLIPHTLKTTTLGLRAAGDRVNVETDFLLKMKQKAKILRGD